VPVFGGNALPFPLRLLPLHLRDPRIVEWPHHLPESVNLSTKLSDEALGRCTWERQVTLGGMASIRFSDVLHGRLRSCVSACSALAKMSGVGTGFPAFLAAPIQAVIASCTAGTAPPSSCYRTAPCRLRDNRHEAIVLSEADVI